MSDNNSNTNNSSSNSNNGGDLELLQQRLDHVRQQSQRELDAILDQHRRIQYSITESQIIEGNAIMEMYGFPSQTPEEIEQLLDVIRRVNGVPRPDGN